MPDNDGGETIGGLYDRLPEGRWVDLPEYGIRAQRLPQPPGGPCCDTCGQAGGELVPHTAPEVDAGVVYQHPDCRPAD